jgi:hypothetical protein
MILGVIINVVPLVIVGAAASGAGCVAMVRMMVSMTRHR